MLPQQVLPYGFVFVYAAFGVSGFILGWVAQRGNYCFVNAMSSIFTTKSYDRFGALLILFGVSALLTGLLVVAGVVPAVDQYYDNYFSGWYIVVGARFSDFGATMAGGCNLSMLYRAASGYVQNWLELVGMMVGTYIFAVVIWPFQSFTMANGILSTSSGAYTEYLPYDIFHSVSQSRLVLRRWASVSRSSPSGSFSSARRGRSGSAEQHVLRDRAWCADAALHQRTREGSVRCPPSGVQRLKLELAEAKEMLLLRKPYGANLSTLLLAGSLLLVFVAGAGYTFNYLVITSSDGGRFLEYILMPFGVNLALNTPWYNDALPILDPSVLMVLMLIVGAFLRQLPQRGLQDQGSAPEEEARHRVLRRDTCWDRREDGARLQHRADVDQLRAARLRWDTVPFSMLFGVWIAVKVQRHLV